MVGTRITGGVYYNCDFVTADMREMLITNTKFSACNFDNAFLSKVRFRKCEFSSCSFYGTDFEATEGLTTCNFGMTCQGLLGNSKGISAILDLERGTYTVAPKYSKVGNNPIPLPPSKIKTSLRELVDPKPLKTVKHYRSPAQQVVKSKKETAEKYGHLDDADEQWSCGGYYGEAAATHYRKHLWGFGERAVLECSNIDEFRGSLSEKR